MAHKSYRYHHSQVLLMLRSREVFYHAEWPANPLQHWAHGKWCSLWCRPDQPTGIVHHWHGALETIVAELTCDWRHLLGRQGIHCTTLLWRICWKPLFCPRGWGTTSSVLECHPLLDHILPCRMHGACILLDFSVQGSSNPCNSGVHQWPSSASTT